MTGPRNLKEVVHRRMEAANGGDMATVVSTYADDGVMAHQGVYEVVGRDAITEWSARLGKSMAVLQVLYRLEEAPPGVVMTWAAVRRDDLTDVVASGIDRFTGDAGGIRRQEAEFQRTAALDAIAEA
jgi:hypothetical protein